MSCQIAGRSNVIIYVINFRFFGDRTKNLRKLVTSEEIFCLVKELFGVRKFYHLVGPSANSGLHKNGGTKGVLDLGSIMPWMKLPNSSGKVN